MIQGQPGDSGGWSAVLLAGEGGEMLKKDSLIPQTDQRMPVVQGWWAARFHQVSLILLLYPPKGWYWFCMRLETSLPGSHSWINQDGGRSSFKGKSPISVPFPLARA